MKLSRQTKGYGIIFLTGMLWGSIGLFIKLVQAEGASSGLTVFFRMFFGFFLLMVVGLILRGPRIFRISRKTLVSTILLGIFAISLQNLTYSEGVAHCGMAMAAVLLYLSPIFVGLFSRVIFRERITGNKVLAWVINLTGCALAATGGVLDVSALSLYGILMLVLAALLYSLTPIIGKITASEEESDPIATAMYMFLFATIFAAVVFRPWVGAADVISMKMVALGAGYGLMTAMLPYLLYFTGLSMITETSKVPVVASVETVVAAILGFFVFQESLGVVKLLGMALVLLSIAIMNRTPRGPAAKEADEEPLVEE